MFPSSARVKLNRVALKDVGQQAVPRRRRVTKPPNEPTDDPEQPEETRPVSGEESVRGTGSDEPVPAALSGPVGPERDTGSTPGGEAEESRVGKDSVGLVVKDDMDRGGGGHSWVEAGSPGRELPQPAADAAANTGGLSPGARSVNTGLSNIARNTHPGPSGCAGSEGSLRRAGYSVCGDCKYISPRWKTLGRKGKKSISPGQQPAFEVNLKDGNSVPETPKKIIIWINQYPKVTLCDIAQKCDALSRDCGYVLPDVLKTKVVHCFKQDMRAGYQFGHSPFWHNKHKNGEGPLAKKEICPRVQSEESVCQSQSPKEHTHAQTFSSHATCHFLQKWTSEGSPTCSASVLLGKRTEKGECRTDMWDRDVEEVPGPGSSLIGVEIRTDKRIKLGDSVKDGILPSTADLASICCENAFGGSSTFGSAVEENSLHKISKKPCDEMDNSEKNDVAQVSELFCQRKEVDTDEQESFTCQRVRVYLRKINSSCARTYMSWPFSNSSWTLSAHARTTVCPAEPIASSARDNGDASVNQIQPGSPSNRTNDVLPKEPTDSSVGTAHLSHLNEERREEDRESILPERNVTRHDMSSCSPNGGNSELMEAGESTTSRPASSMSTPSPSALGLSDWETSTTLSSMSSPFTHGGLSSLSATPSLLPPSSFLLKKVKSLELTDPSLGKCDAMEKTLFYSEETQMTSCSFGSSESSLLLPQEQESDEELLTDNSLPKLEPNYDTSPSNHDKERPLHCSLTGEHAETDSGEFMLPPVLSPITTPQGHSRKSFLLQSPNHSEEGEEEKCKDASEHRRLPGKHIPRIVNGTNEKSNDYLEHRTELEGVPTKTATSPLRKPLSSPSSDEDVHNGNEEGSQDEDEEHVYKNGEQVPSDSKREAALTSGVLTEPCSSPSSEEDDNEASSDEEQPNSARTEGSCPAEMACGERDDTEAIDTEQDVLDEFTAYEQDILLVDVTQDDPELFEDLPKESLLKLGPTRVTEAHKSRASGVVKVQPKIYGGSVGSDQRWSQVKIDNHCDSSDNTEETNSRPWRPQSSSNPSKVQSNTWPATEKQTKNMGPHDVNNNQIIGGPERSQPVQTVNLHNNIPSLLTIKNGPRIKHSNTNPANMAEFRRPKANGYCRQYFSESMSCQFKVCRFQHVPVDGDEKLCIETVIRFAKNPVCLQRAGAIFTSYYQNNPPGVHFSKPVLVSLLWALLKAGMVSDVFSVLNVSLAHKIVPGHEFVLALFNFVRERGLMSFVPELMQVINKMASAGLVLSLDCLDSVKNTTEFQQTGHPNPLVSVAGNHKLSTSASFSEYLNLTHAIVEIELCTKQEDWRRMGEVFRSTCQSSHHPNQVERLSGRIAIALLSESKDKLSLPFAAFAETVCQNEGKDSLILSFFGRIGVSLMLRYHKTHQWAKGRRVVEVLSISKVNYSTLKGLFGNEDGTSRCGLVTVATELFLLSGSVEGALNTLRENKWFLSSCGWPCEATDLESRTRVLIRLAEKTSHRDTLDVLCNLPGLKEPNELVDTSKYSPLFNSHLQVCVDRQTLPVASDTVDFMFSKNLAVDHAVLQTLLHKLGKQNLWLRAREVFRHSLSVGYYSDVSAPHGFMTLIVPCRLGEVELALAFEMFITVNAAAILHKSESAPSCLSITLKRTRSCESEYLSAGSRLLTAACIPQPKLIVHYTAVNAAQEQVFTLDVSSARGWLRNNHLWANEVWTH